MASWPWQQQHLASWALGFICCLTAWYVLREKTGWGWGMQKRSGLVRWYDIWYVILDEFLVLSAGNTINLWKNKFFCFRLTYGDYIELKGTTSTVPKLIELFSSIGSHYWSWCQWALLASSRTSPTSEQSLIQRYTKGTATNAVVIVVIIDLARDILAWFTETQKDVSSSVTSGYGHCDLGVTWYLHFFIKRAGELGLVSGIGARKEKEGRR